MESYNSSSRRNGSPVNRATNKKVGETTGTAEGVMTAEGCNCLAKQEISQNGPFLEGIAIRLSQMELGTKRIRRKTYSCRTCGAENLHHVRRCVREWRHAVVRRPPQVALDSRRCDRSARGRTGD